MRGERNSCMCPTPQPFLFPTRFICPKSFQFKRTHLSYHIPTIFNGKRRVQRYFNRPHAAQTQMMMKKKHTKNKTKPNEVVLSFCQRIVSVFTNINIKYVTCICLVYDFLNVLDLCVAQLATAPKPNSTGIIVYFVCFQSFTYINRRNIM